jgi:apolipoprotein N-acyltransferase
MKKFHPLFFSLLSGLLLFAAWPVSPFGFLIFFAFVPLLWLEQYCARGGQFFRWTYLTLLVWNITTTWWVCNSTIPGGIAAILANSLLMSIPWIGFYSVKRKLGGKYAYPALIFFWLSFEYIHLNWELSWPWLTLGNVFATHPDWVQWYEYTGTSGGSLWIMTVNMLFFFLLRQKIVHSKFDIRYSIALAILLIVPLIVSRMLISSVPGSPDTSLRTGHSVFNTPGAGSGIKNIVIVQPNIDPWDEKFVAGSQEAQLQKLIQLSESQLDSNTALLIWPETAIPVQINEDEIKSNYFMAPVWDFLRKHPNLNLLTGIEGFRFYTEQNKTPYSIKLPGSEKYVDTYNSAALLDSNNFQVYHKSKLVPGVETLPSFLKFLNAWFEKFGGTASGYARQADRTVLNTFNHTYHIAPAVCYESIYGEFMSAYIRNGADLIAVITNDGWWGNTPGYKQHENYARLRAIETRRWVARSANTGISCFIDPYGKVFNAQPWDKAAAIKMQVPANTTLTFFVRYGDLISRAAILGAGLCLVWYLIGSLLCKKQLSINR